MSIKLNYYSFEGEKQDTLNVTSPLFESEIDENSVYYAIQAYRASERQNNARVKDRSEVKGSGRKPWRQKGTGRARHGSRQSPLWVGGGITFGPERDEYNYKANKKIKRKALYSALSKRVKDEKVVIMDEGSYEFPSTKLFTLALKSMGIYGESLLVLWSGENENFYRSCRNIENLKIMEAYKANAYDVLKKNWIIVTREGLDIMQEVFK